MIQLPDDVVSAGYVKISNFEHTQIFSSKSKNFTGTEEAFLKAGHAYTYVQVDKYTRRVTCTQ